jgi:hypothetical protein
MIDISCIIGELEETCLAKKIDQEPVKGESKVSYFKCPIEYLPKGDIHTLSPLYGTTMFTRE